MQALSFTQSIFSSFSSLQFSILLFYFLLFSFLLFFFSLLFSSFFFYFPSLFSSLLSSLFSSLFFSFLFFSSLLFYSLISFLLFFLISYRILFFFSLLLTFNRFWCMYDPLLWFFSDLFTFLACIPNWNVLRLYSIIRHLIIWHFIFWYLSVYPFFYALTWPDLLKIVLSSRYVRLNNPSLKYQRFTSSGCRTVGIRKFEFLAKPQFLLAEFSLRTGAFKKKTFPGVMWSGRIWRPATSISHPSHILLIFSSEPPRKPRPSLLMCF